MDEIRTAGLILAALEVAPAEPSDLTAILADERERASLVGELETQATGPLTCYLRDNLDWGRVEHWRKVLERAVTTHRYSVLVAGQPGYPERLARVWDAPPLLFAKGALPAAETPSIAIVGSRGAKPSVLEATGRVAAELSRGGCDVVSGLATGVDGAAHRGALLAGGSTTAVLGTGIEVVYPREHEPLAAQVSQHGLLLSQFPPNAPRTSTTFLRRNRVIAALSDVSLIMDGRSRSGSRHEIERAIDYGRRALLWAPALRSEDWAQSLSAQGQAAFVDSVEEIAGVIAEVRA